MRTFSAVTLEHRPIIVSDNTSVTEACNQMRDRRAGAALVVTRESGRLVGIFTGRDAVCRVLAQRRDPSTTCLADVMTPNPVTMPPGQTAAEALKLMSAGGFRHVPLVKNDRVVGVVSRGDFHDAGQSQDEEEREPWAIMR
jgi:CBS domain-containing protein